MSKKEKPYKEPQEGSIESLHLLLKHIDSNNKSHKRHINQIKSLIKYIIY